MQDNIKDKNLKDAVFEYVKSRYSSEIEHPWSKYPNHAVFRHSDNKKWFGCVLNIQKNKIGLTGNETTDILNVKIDDVLLHDFLLQQDGYFPGYHMNKKNWISIALDGTVSLEEIFSRIDMSFNITASRKKKEILREPKDWLVPANPKFYDILHAFDDTDIVNWKQGSGIKKGDIVFLYVAAPVSAIMYKCRVIETNLPYEFKNDDIVIKKLMKIKLLRRYEPEDFTFSRLKDEYDIFAVRGPRGIPNSLKEALEK